MVDYITKVEQIDRRRRWLWNYQERFVKTVFLFTPKWREKRLRQIDKIWDRLNRDRAKLMDIIMDDPRLRREWQERQDRRLAGPVIAHERTRVRGR